MPSVCNSILSPKIKVASGDGENTRLSYSFSYPSEGKSEDAPETDTAPTSIPFHSNTKPGNGQGIRSERDPLSNRWPKIPPPDISSVCSWPYANTEVDILGMARQTGTSDTTPGLPSNNKKKSQAKRHNNKRDATSKNYPVATRSHAEDKFDTIQPLRIKHANGQGTRSPLRTLPSHLSPTRDTHGTLFDTKVLDESIKMCSTPIAHDLMLETEKYNLEDACSLSMTTPPRDCPSNILPTDSRLCAEMDSLEVADKIHTNEATPVKFDTIQPLRIKHANGQGTCTPLRTLLSRNRSPDISHISCWLHAYTELDKTSSNDDIPGLASSNIIIHGRNLEDVSMFNFETFTLYCEDLKSYGDELLKNQVIFDYSAEVLHALRTFQRNPSFQEDLWQDKVQELAKQLFGFSGRPYVCASEVLGASLKVLRVLYSIHPDKKIKSFLIHMGFYFEGFYPLSTSLHSTISVSEYEGANSFSQSCFEGTQPVTSTVSNRTPLLPERSVDSFERRPDIESTHLSQDRDRANLHKRSDSLKSTENSKGESGGKFGRKLRTAISFINSVVSCNQIDTKDSDETVIFKR